MPGPSLISMIIFLSVLEYNLFFPVKKEISYTVGYFMSQKLKMEICLWHKKWTSLQCSLLLRTITTNKVTYYSKVTYFTVA